MIGGSKILNEEKTLEPRTILDLFSCWGDKGEQNYAYYFYFLCTAEKCTLPEIRRPNQRGFFAKNFSRHKFPLKTNRSLHIQML